MRHTFTMCVAVIIAATMLWAPTINAQETNNTAPETETTIESEPKVSFAWEAGFDLMSAYIWRGGRQSGLSLQPSAAIGYDGQVTNLRAGVWANIASSDWRWQKPSDPNDPGTGTYFVPELDVNIDFSFYGVKAGMVHYYYFGGSNYFSWQKVQKIIGEGNTSQTEVYLGYDFNDLLNVPLHVKWYTIVAGDDVKPIAGKRAYSSYIELGYDLELPKNLTLSAELGMTPWKSTYTDYEGDFAVTNISLKFEKTWEVKDLCEVSLYAIGALNPWHVDGSNAYVGGCGDAKMAQKLNGAVGLGIWF